MTDQDVRRARPVDVMRELGRRFAAGDRVGALRLYHPDIRIEQPASLPHGGWYAGREGLDRMAAEFGRHWTREISDPRLLDAGSANVVQITTQTWTARATGRSATVDVVELVAFTGGLVAVIRVFPQDTRLLLATLVSSG